MVTERPILLHINLSSSYYIKKSRDIKREILALPTFLVFELYDYTTFYDNNIILKRAQA